MAKYIENVFEGAKIEQNENWRDEHLDERLKEMAKSYGKEADDEFTKNENVRSYIKNGIESEKALDFLVKNAKIK